MTAYHLKSHAKLNLYLKVFPPREDGLHPIKSLFQIISLHDVLTIRKTREKGININSQNKALENDNILIRIYEKFKSEIPFGVEIDLEKNIPLGGGLGGGSSNAATFLSFLNAEAGWGLGHDSVMERGKIFGSDIPYFFMGGTALVEGVGDQITAQETSPFTHFILINPNRHSDTAQAYRDVDDQESLRSDTGEIPEFGVNDLKDVVFSRIPELKEIEDFCRDEGMGKLMMSGSGATCFLAYRDEENITRDLALLKGRFSGYFLDRFS